MNRLVYLVCLLLVACETQHSPTRGDQPDFGELPAAGRRIIDANNWRVVVSPDGNWGYDPREETLGINGGGAEFPANSGQNGLYAGGLYVGGLKNGVPIVSSIEFGSEFTPGFITNNEAAEIVNLKASNPDSMRVWIISDDPTSADWQTWPKDIGAPVDNSGLPRRISDMDSWTVFHDLNADTLGYDDPPGEAMGLQIVRRTMMYSVPPLRDVFLLDFTITNKSTTAYQSAYITLWCDHDLREASNDVIGTDSSRNMVYVYNYTDGDSWNNQEYAIGYKLLYFSNYAVPHLDATAWYSNGTDPYNDQQRYFVQQGLRTNGALSFGADSSRPQFVWTGDPVTGVGLIDTMRGNRRLSASVGPFTMESGGVYRVVYAILGASAATRKDAIVELRRLADKLVYFPD